MKDDGSGTPRRGGESPSLCKKQTVGSLSCFTSIWLYLMNDARLFVWSPYSLGCRNDPLTPYPNGNVIK